MKQRVCVLGGAGFVGSAIAKAFAENRAEVFVVDGFLAHTGARKENLAGIPIKMICKRIEELNGDEFKTIGEQNVIVDAMGWTSHLDALRDPEYDMRLNLMSHLHFLTRVPEDSKAQVIYLGSRGQYGKNGERQITEASKMEPDDIQGIHKTASDHYFRVYSKLKGINVASIRFPNCYGPGQKYLGQDIGIIGSFIKDALRGQNIEVFGEQRFRNVVYVDDVANCVVRLAERGTTGYETYNLSGIRVSLVELVEKIIRLSGKGTYQVAPMPRELQKIDMGDVPVGQEKLLGAVGAFSYSDMDKTLMTTINYFRRRLNDLAL